MMATKELVDMVLTERAKTDDIAINFKLIVQATKGTTTVTPELVMLVRERILEILDEDDGESDEELATDRISIDTGLPTVEQVRMFYENEQKRIPIEIRDYVRDLMGQLLEDLRVDIAKLRLGTDTWDNGVFFVDNPELVLRDGSKLAWEDVFDDDHDLSEWTGDLSDAFGPLSRGMVLVVDLDTLECKMEEE